MKDYYVEFVIAHTPYGGTPILRVRTRSAVVRFFWDDQISLMGPDLADLLPAHVLMSLMKNKRPGFYLVRMDYTVGGADFTVIKATCEPIRGLSSKGPCNLLIE